MGKNSVSKYDLKIMLEPHMHSFIQRERYSIESFSPLSLFTHNRFDLAIKLLYIENRQYKDTFYNRIYEEHVKAISLGSFKEPGNDEKNSLKAFIDTFNELYLSFCNRGFDVKKSLIPLSENGTILNGAHRLACAIALNKSVQCVALDTGDHIYDYKFFFDRGLNQQMLDAAATKFVETGTNIYVATIWPAARGDMVAAESIIPNIIYKKHVRLNVNGGTNLISILYQGCEWLGDLNHNSPGVSAKLAACFSGSNPLTVFAFQASTLNDVQDVKSKIRKIFGIGKHSVHITDTKKEAITAARVLLNDNAVHFLNYAKPRKFQSTFEKIKEFKHFLKTNEFNPDETVLDAGIVLSLYGLREADDIDYLSAGGKSVTCDAENVNHHQDSLSYHEVAEIDLVMDPTNYFYFDDIKFVSFRQIHRLKENRAHTKDKNDLMIMTGMVEKNKVRLYVGSVLQKITFARIRIYNKILVLLRGVGLYKIVRWGYRKINKKKISQ